MRRPAFLFLPALLATAPVQAADRRFAVQDFDRIVVEGPYEVRLTVGGAASAIARGDAQAVQAVAIEVRGTTLRIRPDRGAWAGTPARAAAPPVILLTTRSLRAAQVIGGGSLAANEARGLRIDLAVDGSGRIAIARLVADSASFGVRGAGGITAAGAAKTLTADVQGSAALTAPDLAIDDLTLSAATSGEIALAARRTATVTANGLGRVTIAGRPACTVRGPAAGAVRCGVGR